VNGECVGLSTGTTVNVKLCVIKRIVQFYVVCLFTSSKCNDFVSVSVFLGICGKFAESQYQLCFVLSVPTGRIFMKIDI
jgi:hypothetical protein